MMMVRSRSSAVRPLVAIAVASLGVISCAAFSSTEAPPLSTNLAVPDGLKTKEEWQKSAMIPLDLSLGTVTKQDEVVSVSNMIEQQSKSLGAVLFAVRRPG